MYFYALMLFWTVGIIQISQSVTSEYTYKCQCKEFCSKHEINITVTCGQYIWCCNKTHKDKNSHTDTSHGTNNTKDIVKGAKKEQQINTVKFKEETGEVKGEFVKYDIPHLSSNQNELVNMSDDQSSHTNNSNDTRKMQRLLNVKVIRIPKGHILTPDMKIEFQGEGPHMHGDRISDQTDLLAQHKYDISLAEYKLHKVRKRKLKLNSWPKDASSNDDSFRLIIPNTYQGGMQYNENSKETPLESFIWNFIKNKIRRINTKAYIDAVNGLSNPMNLYKAENIPIEFNRLPEGKRLVYEYKPNRFIPFFNYDKKKEGIHSIRQNGQKIMKEQRDVNGEFLEQLKSISLSYDNTANTERDIYNLHKYHSENPFERGGQNVKFRDPNFSFSLPMDNTDIDRPQNSMTKKEVNQPHFGHYYVPTIVSNHWQNEWI